VKCHEPERCYQDERAYHFLLAQLVEFPSLPRLKIQCENHSFWQKRLRMFTHQTVMCIGSQLLSPTYDRHASNQKPDSPETVIAPLVHLGIWRCPCLRWSIYCRGWSTKPRTGPGPRLASETTKVYSVHYPILRSEARLITVLESGSLGLDRVLLLHEWRRGPCENRCAQRLRHQCGKMSGPKGL
jgi:hypothetical protein